MQQAGRANDAEEVDVHVLLDFLRMMHSNKEAEASHIKGHLDMIDRDIQQVLGSASQISHVFGTSLRQCRIHNVLPPCVRYSSHPHASFVVFFEVAILLSGQLPSFALSRSSKPV